MVSCAEFHINTAGSHLRQPQTNVAGSQRLSAISATRASRECRRTASCECEQPAQPPYSSHSAGPTHSLTSSSGSLCSEKSLVSCTAASPVSARQRQADGRGHQVARCSCLPAPHPHPPCFAPAPHCAPCPPHSPVLRLSSRPCLPRSAPASTSTGVPSVAGTTVSSWLCCRSCRGALGRGQESVGYECSLPPPALAPPVSQAATQSQLTAAGCSGHVASLTSTLSFRSSMKTSHTAEGGSWVDVQSSKEGSAATSQSGAKAFHPGCCCC